MRLIDADAIKIIPPYGTGMTFARGAIYVLDKIAEMPTIEAEPVRHGEWKEGVYDRYYDAYEVCSACGYEKRLLGNRTFYRYCPNCGARMERSEESK